MIQFVKKCDRWILGTGILFYAIGAVARQMGSHHMAFSFLSGAGCGLILVAVVSMFIRFRSPQRAQQQEIERKDERNIQVRLLAGNVTFLVALLIMFVLAVVFLVLDYSLASILTICAMAATVLVFSIALVYYNKKM
ncbi:MAG: hypothetical protein LBP28_03965 [Coriobacteriales bacterium]|jgi:Ca2+/Na+ antiporter|nr:hypothetical protein [Coriobacteriales bacterium]